MKIKIEMAHMHQRGFVPGVNKQIEKGLNQETCPGIEMYILDNGLLECFYEKRHFFIPTVNFQALLVGKYQKEEVKEETKKETKKAK